MENINALVVGLGLETTDTETLLYLQIMKLFKAYPAKPEKSPDQNEVALFKLLFGKSDELFPETHFRLSVQTFALMLSDDLFKPNPARLVQGKLEDFLRLLTERLPANRTFSFLLNFKTIHTLVFLISSIWHCCDYALDDFLKA